MRAAGFDFRFGAGLTSAILAAALSGCALRPGTVGYLVNSPDRRPATVQTTYGPVQGMATAQGRAFLAIPFAAPPVGPLRLRAPQPPTPWSEPRDAARPGFICPQASLPGGGAQSEDCLTLNVYTPSNASTDRPAPVMVWIYGGGFAIGANDEYDLSRMAQKQGLVMVAMNYRLGALGFLAHPALRAEGEGSGDFALLDQQAALKWVRANIARFGGDPRNVTLFGESAGAWSVCYQLASPGAAGLFRHAIIESGACTTPDSTISQAQAEQGGVAMAATLGCGDPTTAADCLRRLPVKALLKAKAQRRGILGRDSWAPAFGGATLPLAPLSAFRQGRFNAVAVINGTNRDEGRLFLNFKRFMGQLRSRASYEKIIGLEFDARTPQVLAEYADEAKRDRGVAYADILTDSTFACPALTLNALLERRAPVYAYEFDDPDAVTTLPRAPFSPPMKAYHSSEIVYVMQTPWAIATPAKFVPAQRELSERIQAWWAAFAHSGDPDVAGTPNWAADRAGVPLQLRPDGVSLASGFFAAHHCGFWRGLGY